MRGPTRITDRDMSAALARYEVEKSAALEIRGLYGVGVEICNLRVNLISFRPWVEDDRATTVVSIPHRAVTDVRLGGAWKSGSEVDVVVESGSGANSIPFPDYETAKSAFDRLSRRLHEDQNGAFVDEAGVRRNADGQILAL